MRLFMPVPSSKFSTIKIFRARFWPWPAPFFRCEYLSCSMFARKRTSKMIPLVRRTVGARAESHMQTRIFPKIHFNQNHHTFTSILLTKIVLCSNFPWTKSINCNWFAMKSAPLPNEEGTSYTVYGNWPWLSYMCHIRSTAGRRKAPRRWPGVHDRAIAAILGRVSIWSFQVSEFSFVPEVSV